jgi:hypothetical protein
MWAETSTSWYMRSARARVSLDEARKIILSCAQRQGSLVAGWGVSHFLFEAIQINYFYLQYKLTSSQEQELSSSENRRRYSWCRSITFDIATSYSWQVPLPTWSVWKQPNEFLLHPLRRPHVFDGPVLQEQIVSGRSVAPASR